MSRGQTGRLLIRSVIAAIAAVLIVGLMMPAAFGHSSASSTAIQAPAGDSATKIDGYRLAREQWAGAFPQSEPADVEIAAAAPAITSLSPPAGSPYNLVIITGTGFGDLRGTNYVSFGSAQLKTDSDYQDWTDTKIWAIVPEGVSGTVSVSVTTTMGTSNTISFKVQYVLYFAEGYTGAGFDEYLCLLNMSDAGVGADITYTFKDASKQQQHVTIGGTTRLTVYVNSVVGRDKEVSVQISSQSPIFAERPMYFNYGGWTGGHDVVGAGWIADIAILPEGFTGAGFQEYICLLNPNNVTANVAIGYLITGEEPIIEPLIIAPQKRVTVNVNKSAGAGKSVSCMVMSNQCIVAERPMYFNYGGWTGGHDVMGLPYLSSDYYFAEGCTRPGFSEYLCLMNGGDIGTVAQVTYMFPDGTSWTKNVNVPANARETVDVNQDCPNSDVAVRIVANPPVAAERPMYFNYKGMWSGGHTVIGAAFLLDTWIFAEGYTGAGFEEYLCLMNPNTYAVEAAIVFMFTDGSTQPLYFSIGASTRMTVCVNDVVGPNREVSSVAMASDYILAERPMYFNYGGVWDGGHDVIGL